MEPGLTGIQSVESEVGLMSTLINQSVGYRYYRSASDFFGESDCLWCIHRLHIRLMMQAIFLFQAVGSVVA